VAFREYSVVPAKETFQKHGVTHLSSRDGCFIQEERNKTSVQQWMPTLRIAVHFITNLQWMIHAMFVYVMLKA